MPDSITIDDATVEATTRRPIKYIHVDWEADPVALGLVTRDEYAAMQQHLRALKRKEVHGLANPKALFALAVLNGWPLNPAVSRGSLRFWALVAHYEARWVSARLGRPTSPPPSKLLPRELLGRAVLDCGRHLGCQTYYPHSRFALTLAETIGDVASAARNRSFDRAERRRLLLEWRENHQAAMKASLAAIAKYRAALTAGPKLRAA